MRFLPPVPLALTIGVAVALVAGASGATLSSAASKAVERDRFHHLRHDAQQRFAAALDPRFHSKSEEIGRIGRRLVVIEAIKGGAIYDVTGARIDAFGEVPVATFNAIRFGMVDSRPDSETGRAEFHFAPEVYGTPFHLVLRVATAETAAEVADLRSRMLLISLIGALLGGLVAGGMVHWRIAAPARRIANVVAAAAVKPERADAVPLSTGRRDEVGRLQADLDRFLQLFAEAWRTRIVVAEAILDSAPVGVVQMTSSGRIIAANPAAFSMLGTVASASGEITAPDIRFADDGTSLPLAGVETALGDSSRLVEISNSLAPRFALAGAVALADDEGEGRSLLLLTDATDLENARADLSADLEGKVADIAQLTRRQAELRLMLECCLAMLSASPSGPDAHVDPTNIVETWIAECAAVGMIGRGDMGADGPSVSGAEADIEAVFRLALLTVYAKVGRAPATVTVEGRGINFETAAYTFKARRGGGDGQATAADWQLALAALRAAVRRVRGQVSEFNATDGEASVRIILRGAAERLSTGLSRAGA